MNARVDEFSIFREFKTLIGGVISIGTFVVLLLYAYIIFLSLIQKKDTRKNKNTTTIDLINDSNALEIQDTTFAFAFNLIGSSFDIMTDPTYLTLKLTQYTKTKGEGGALVTKSTNIEYQRCGDTFKYSNQTLVKKIGLDKYICPKTRDMFVLGNSYSDNYTYFEITFSRCFDRVDCHADEDITAALLATYVHVAVVNTFFNFDDYVAPVHTYLDDRFYFDLVPGYEKEQILYIKQNSAELQDSVWHYTPDGDQVDFIGVDRMDSRLNTEEKKGNLLTVRFSKDPQTDSYSRSVFSVLDFFGNIGGLNEVLEKIGELIVTIFASRLFTYSIVANLYQVDTSPTEKKVNDVKSHPHENMISNTENQNKEKESKGNRSKVYRLSEVEYTSKHNDPQQARDEII